MRLTHRDLAIIEAVYAYRALTTPQIEKLLFPGDQSQFQVHAKQPSSGKSNRCRHRLKLLFHHGYLYREELPTPLAMGRKPLIYFLDKQGKETLCSDYGLSPQDIDWQPRHNTVGSRFLEHLLKTNDARLAVTLGAQRHRFDLANWLDDRTLRKQQNRDHVYITNPQTGKRRKVALVPDGYFHLKTEAYEFHFLLEIDRRTVVGQYTRWGGKDWARKVRAYIAYFTPQPEGQLSLFEQRFGTPNLRVLTVTTGQTRLNNLKRITEQSGGRGRFWFTTFEAMKPEAVLTEPIWHKAGQPGLHCLAV
ncbi:MAG: replication-relaxation family protein [Anaerolineae bacterium]|nr:replication-relaxation family protein [Anaerolineae bacterium]